MSLLVRYVSPPRAPLLEGVDLLMARFGARAAAPEPTRSCASSRALSSCSAPSRPIRASLDATAERDMRGQRPCMSGGLLGGPGERHRYGVYGGEQRCELDDRRAVDVARSNYVILELLDSQRENTAWK